MLKETSLTSTGLYKNRFITRTSGISRVTGPPEEVVCPGVHQLNSAVLVHIDVICTAYLIIRRTRRQT